MNDGLTRKDAMLRPLLLGMAEGRHRHMKLAHAAIRRPFARGAALAGAGYRARQTVEQQRDVTLRRPMALA